MTPPDNKDGLKPCPFCGTKPIFGWNGTEEGGYHYVECQVCSGSAGVPFCGVHADDPDETVEIWNRRALLIEPLVWEDFGGERHAKVIFHRYTVFRCGEDDWSWRIQGTQIHDYSHFPSAESAQAACESDWRQRIESCLLEK